MSFQRRRCRRSRWPGCSKGPLRSSATKPFPIPAANSSIPYTNPYGVRLGPCNLCGFCERFGCFLYSKASPQTAILPILVDRPNLEVRTGAYVTKILRDSSGKIATGVLYIDDSGAEVEQPADLVILSAFQMHNVRLLLLSESATPYDPATGKGVVGKNYAYQMCAQTAAYFSEDVEINPFIGAGSAGLRVIDEFNSDHFDHSGLGFIGGSLIFAGGTGGRPIDQMMLPPGRAALGPGLEGRYPQALSPFRAARHAGNRDVVPGPLSVARPDLQGCARPAALAHHVRLARQRIQNGRVLAFKDGRDCPRDEA